MDEKNEGTDEKTSNEIPDDLLILSRTYSLTQLSYIDISKQENLVLMMQRWPLLAELAQLQQDKNNENNYAGYSHTRD